MRNRVMVIAVLFSLTVTLVAITPLVGWAGTLNGAKSGAIGQTISNSTGGGQAIPSGSWLSRWNKRIDSSGPEWWADFEEMYEKYRDIFENND